MNRQTCFRLGQAALLLHLAAAISLAMPFDPVFRVLRIKGECAIAPPDSTVFSPIKPGKAYPFGSTVRTVSLDSEAIISFCDNNGCTLFAGSTARFTDEAGDRENRTVHLLAGKLEVELDRSEQKFIKYTNRVFVQTAVAIVSGEKAKFAVTVARQNDTHESIFECSAGMIGVSGAQFQAPVVKEGAILKVTGPTDLSWLRVQTVKGEVPYDIRNDMAEPISYPTKPGAILKINQQVAEQAGIRHVVLRTMKPDGTTETNFTYKLMADAPKPDAPAGDENRTGVEEPQQGI